MLNLCPCQVLLLVPKEVFHIKKREKERKRQLQNKKEPHKKNQKCGCPIFTAGREESQSHAERSANECSALVPHPSGVPSPSGE